MEKSTTNRHEWTRTQTKNQRNQRNPRLNYYEIFVGVYLSRQAAQEQAAKAGGSLEDERYQEDRWRHNYTILAHENHYIGRVPGCNHKFQNFFRTLINADSTVFTLCLQQQSIVNNH